MIKGLLINEEADLAEDRLGQALLHEGGKGEAGVPIVLAIAGGDGEGAAGHLGCGGGGTAAGTVGEWIPIRIPEETCQGKIHCGALRCYTACPHGEDLIRDGPCGHGGGRLHIS